LWRKDNEKETKRLYRFIDDIFDRVSAGDVERYAFTQRVKRELAMQPPIPPPEDKEEPKFVHNR